MNVDIHFERNAVYLCIIRSVLIFKLIRSRLNMSCISEVNKTKESTTASDSMDVPVIKEGHAEIIVPATKNVFYNPVQEFNRDLSVAVLTLVAEDNFKKVSSKHKDVGNDNEGNLDYVLNQPKTGTKYEDGLVILEALSATGLRSIRYAKEVPGIKQIVANDISQFAVTSIQENIARNGVQDLISTSHDDAVMVMYRHRQPALRFHAVDLDPYGCPSPFLDAAVQCVSDGGVLLVTCTDMAVLAGNTPETCYIKYGAVSLRTKACHEMALRITLQCIESHANRYGRYIVPLLSLSADFYVRVFVRIHTSPIMCKRSSSKLSHVYRCVGCDTAYLQPLGVCKQEEGKSKQVKFIIPHGPPVGKACEHCGQKYQIGGPIWNAGLHDPEFVSRLEQLAATGDFGTSRRMQGVLAVIQEELNDVPLYYTLSKLCSTIRSETMPMLRFRSALMNTGYRVSFSHASRLSIKTDAPPDVVWDVMRTWERDHPVKRDRLSEAGRTILSKEPSTKISFEIHPEANPESKQRGLVRFQENPAPYWGPGTRAKTNFVMEDTMKKRKKNQGKRTRSDSSSPGNGEHKRILSDTCKADAAK